MNYKTNCLYIICCLLVAIGYLFPAVVIAQEEPTYDEINNIASKLNCPTCSGISLSDCPTVTCQQWRDQIGDLLKKGYTEEEVLNYFVTQYGQQVLQEPPRTGSTLFLWMLPGVALLIGGVWLIYLLRQWQNPQPVVTGEQVPSGNYLDQVEQDLSD
jgi:cytochrome c-type biogenesis protein CcmH